MNYIYETHLHTKEASACSGTPAQDYIEYMMGLGYSGMIVTDHFFNGNSSVPRDLPWEKRVEQYCSGYEHARIAAQGKDFNVMFGMEYNFQGDEYLLYGVDKAWLLSHPDIMDKTRSQVHDLVNEAGGIMIQAHPYRERGYLNAIRLSPECVDGVEAFNAGNPDYQNAWGYRYAKEHGFKTTGGSDVHYTSQDDMGGTSFPYKIESIEDFVRAFKAGDATPVFRKNVHDQSTAFMPITQEKSLMEPEKDPTLPIFINKD